jgi:predicted nucleotidyltransferase
MDKIYNRAKTKTTIVSSGSLAEGLDLPGSDIDMMVVFNGVQVIQNVQHMNRSARYSTTLRWGKRVFLITRSYQL